MMPMIFIVPVFCVSNNPGDERRVQSLQSTNNQAIPERKSSMENVPSAVCDNPYAYAVNKFEGAAATWRSLFWNSASESSPNPSHRSSYHAITCSSSRRAAE
jgi:hypothetical protein